ncbi:MAG: hypothetical protein ABMB14_18170 [Myxococcota bacterium]
MRTLGILGFVGLGMTCDDGVRVVGPGTGEPGAGGSTYNGSDTGTGAERTGWACDLQTVDGSCIVYTGSGWTQGAAESECGQALVESCPYTALGGCRVVPGDPLQYDVWYYVGDYHAPRDRDFLLADCENNAGEPL